MSNEPEQIERRDEKGLKPRQVPLYILLWFVSGILSVLGWIALRAAITAVAAAVANAVPIEWQVAHQWYLRWTVRAADPCSIVVLTVLAFLTILGVDPLYRNALRKGTIRKTFLIVTAIQAGILLLSGVAVAITSRLTA